MITVLAWAELSSRRWCTKYFGVTGGIINRWRLQAWFKDKRYWRARRLALATLGVAVVRYEPISRGNGRVADRWTVYVFDLRAQSFIKLQDAVAYAKSTATCTTAIYWWSWRKEVEPRPAARLRRVRGRWCKSPSPLFKLREMPNMQAISQRASDDSSYDQLLDNLRESFSNQMIVDRGDPRDVALFTTSVAASLWDVYINSFDEPERQRCNCNTCLWFIRTYGSLVTIDENGNASSPIWDPGLCEGNPAYATAFANMRRHVGNAAVTGVFYSRDSVWGNPVTGEWKHLHLAPPTFLRFQSRVLSESQAAAAKLEDFRNVSRALGEFSAEHLNVALQLLETDALYRAEHVIGPVRWLRDLHAARQRAKGRLGENIVWREVAVAPPGFCHPRSSMAGSLLEDIASGMAFEEVAARFKAKMHPLQYQRPQAPPKAGNIAEAEKLVEKLGVANSLKRRFCRPDEIVALWTPPPAEPARGGVFACVKARGEEPKVEMNIPTANITWAKFRRDVLPTAARIQVRTGTDAYAFYVLTTAEDASAPPILQWDSVEQRNPVAWYTWVTPPAISSFGLGRNTWYDVSHVTLRPCNWYDDTVKHYGDGVMFVIPEARETRFNSLCLFPNSLKSELRGIRAVVEGYSNANKLSGAEGPHVIGPMLEKSSRRGIELRVTSASGVVNQWNLDRLE